MNSSDISNAGGQASRRGPFRAGERAQITDVKGRLHTVLLTSDGFFQSGRGSFRHSELIGKPDGTVLETSSGHQLLALRPLLSDYVMSMPRGAAVIYPKDAAQIVQYADIFPGARVLESGVGSGGLTMSLLSAIGGGGTLTSIEIREDFAEIAAGNVDSWFGGRHPAWNLLTGDFSEVARERVEEGSIDRVVLDMLSPWLHLEQCARVLAPGGLLLAYLTTTTQLSRFVEECRATERFTEPSSWETMVRGWHVQGLSVRPDHRMVAHTGFLVTTRALAPDTAPPERTRRPAPAAYGPDLEWSPADIGQRTINDKKVRRVKRDIAKRARMEQTGTSSNLPPQARGGDGDVVESSAVLSGAEVDGATGLEVAEQVRGSGNE